MRLTGLSMLQVQDATGRIISSGHFRNEHGRVDAELTAALSKMSGGVVLSTIRAADGEFMALVRGESFQIAGQTFTMVGGVKVDDAFVARLARDRTIAITLDLSGGRAVFRRGLGFDQARERGSADDVAVGELEIPLIRTAADKPVEVVQARLRVTQPLTALRVLLRSADSWFLMTAAGTGVVALCSQCGCRHASAGRWRRSPRRRRCWISIASTWTSTPATTKSVRWPASLVTLQAGCARAPPACARPSDGRRWATSRARSTTTSRTA